MSNYPKDSSRRQALKLVAGAAVAVPIALHDEQVARRPFEQEAVRGPEHDVDSLRVPASYNSQQLQTSKFHPNLLLQLPVLASMENSELILLLYFLLFLR